MWPLRLAGGLRMMQEPHLVHYPDGLGVVIMDSALLKCRGLGLGSCEWLPFTRRPLESSLSSFGWTSTSA